MISSLTVQSDGQIIGRTQILAANSPSVDAFGRWRTSEPFSTYQNKQIHTLDSTAWNQRLSGGGSITFATNEPMPLLNVGAASGDEATNQTSRYLAYVPGASNLIKITAVMNEPKDNLRQELLYGDDNNAMGLRLDGLNAQLIIRSSTSGSPVENVIQRDDWNIDKMDGTGQSGITLDFSKSQIFAMDFQWLGVGSVRFYFNIDGSIVPIHQENHANKISTTYTATPSLPIRYSIKNTGITSGPSTLKQICCSVESEGGNLLPGTELSTPITWANARSFTARTPIIAIRLKNTLNGKPNRRTVRLLDIHAFADDENCLLEVAHMHAPTAITATWTSIGSESGVEYSTNISTITGNPQHVIDGAFIAATPGVGGPGSSSLPIGDFVNEHSFISQNFTSTNSQVFVVFGQGDGSATRALCGITFLEFE